MNFKRYFCPGVAPCVFIPGASRSLTPSLLAILSFPSERARARCLCRPLRVMHLVAPLPPQTTRKIPCRWIPFAECSVLPGAARAVRARNNRTGCRARPLAQTKTALLRMLLQSLGPGEFSRPFEHEPRPWSWTRSFQLIPVFSSLLSARSTSPCRN